MLNVYSGIFQTYQSAEMRDIIKSLLRLTIQNLIVDSFFTCDDNIKVIFAALKTFRSWFDSSISVKHVKQTILCVKLSVLH